MSKNIEINYKNEDGSYEALYPMVQYENVDGIVLPEAIVDTWDGAVVVASNGNKSSSGIAEEGKVVLDLPGYGNWNLSSSYGDFTGADTLNVDTVKQYNVSVIINMPTIVATVSSGTTTIKAKKGVIEVAGTVEGTEAIVRVPEYGEWTVTVTTYGADVSTNITVSSVTNYPVSLKLEFSSLTWQQINTVVSNGGVNSFAVGNNKSLVLNGTAGDLSFGNTTAYATIIGINHNTTYEGNNKLHLQLALDSNNTRLLGTAAWNATATNSGGWNSCRMRTRECANLVNCLPSDLQTVIKTVSKYTATGGQTSNVIASSDKFFLLSEFEVFGRVNSGRPEEENYQKQYSWYTNHRTLKYLGSDSGYWYLRSPAAGTSNKVCGVSMGSGLINTYGDASMAQGVAPCFCI